MLGVAGLNGMVWSGQGSGFVVYDVIFCLYEYDEDHYFGKIVAKTDYMTVWEKWMDSVKEVF